MTARPRHAGRETDANTGSMADEQSSASRSERLRS